MERMNHKAAFVDAQRVALIQRVNSVMQVADVLLAKQQMNSEEYSNIRAHRTNEMKMRELYLSLNTKESKAAFYDALQKYEPHLLIDLEEEYRLAGAAPTFSEQPSQAEQPSQVTGSLKVDDRTRRMLKEQWQKHSKANKYRSKFEEFLKDPDLKSLGNGKVFLCKRNHYKIGSGAPGTQVYIGMRNDGTEVAVKRMDKDNEKQLESEMKVLRELEHPNIVKYLDFTEDEDFVYLCLQLCEYNFEEYKKSRELDEGALKKVTKEVLLGLQVLHDAGIIHRDIKPSNILIDVQGNALLADFGISRKINKDTTTVYTLRIGTRGWEAAEILNGTLNGECRYKRCADIQVAGMLVYYILSGGDHPFGTDLEVERNILSGNYNLAKVTDVEAKHLIERMLAHEPQERLKVKEAVDHPYFWDDAGRRNFLRIVGDKEPIQNSRQRDPELLEVMAKYPNFSGWKSEIKDLETREQNLPDDLCGLLRFLRNRLVHKTDIFNENYMYKSSFPGFYIYTNQMASDMGWHKDNNWE